MITPHYNMPVSTFKHNNGLLQALAVLLILCVAVYALSRVLGVRGAGAGVAASGSELEQATTAKLLHAANARVYGSARCGYTVRQMERFGRSVHLIDYVECGGGDGGEKCGSIEGFPTWKIGSHVLMGDQPLSALRSAAERALNGGAPEAPQSIAVPMQDGDAAAASTSDSDELEPVSCDAHQTLGTAY